MKLFQSVCLILFVSIQALIAEIPIANEPDQRVQIEGKGWRLEKAVIKDTDRPRILLIGDSILSGYARHVIKKLKGKAYVDIWVNPYHQSEGLNKILALVLSEGPYDLVHFNVGLHGWQEGRIKEGTFVPLTKDYVKVIRSVAPKAKLIWANSTPVTVKNNVKELDPEINPTIIEHNRMADSVMKEMGVPINDFYSVLDKNRSLAKGDRFHWTGPAYSLLGEMVVNSAAREILSKP
ncbi:MAG: SGNH/GDSL hydrolase family protein [Verrucomicrobiales bacterium]|nr:SGNH/GDSL hydrolase family protein [Verrucomicrobiales bacterium]